jgi:lipoyl-dependent peroxiredoxin
VLPAPATLRAAAARVRRALRRALLRALLRARAGLAASRRRAAVGRLRSSANTSTGGRMKRKAQAVWTGAGRDGKGVVSTFSGALQQQPYSARGRFEDEEGRAGTNPEELIAAAHAGCFTMALAFQLSGAGHTPEELSTEAVVDLQQAEGGWTITAVQLNLRGRVPGVSAEEFQELATKAKEGCPVSRVLNADITLTAELD